MMYNRMCMRRNNLACVLVIVMSLDIAAFAQNKQQKREQEKTQAAQKKEQEATASAKKAEEAITAAKKQVAESDHALRTAQDDLTKVTAKLQAEFEKSPEWADANSAMKQAQADREAAIKPVLAALAEQSSYKTAVEEKNKRTA